MRRFLALFAVLGVAGTASAAWPSSIGFQYTIEREHEGAIIESSFLKGFDIKDGLRLRVKLHQESYCYVIVSVADGGYRLVFPDLGTLKAGGLPVGEWARIPKSTFLRMGEDPKVQRMYIVVAAQRVPELDEAAAKGNPLLTDARAFEIRDRYHGEGTYTRDLDGQTVSVKYRSKASEAPSIVEEIAVQAIDTLKRSDSK